MSNYKMISNTMAIMELNDSFKLSIKNKGIKNVEKFVDETSKKLKTLKGKKNIRFQVMEIKNRYARIFRIN